MQNWLNWRRLARLLPGGVILVTSLACALAPAGSPPTAAPAPTSAGTTPSNNCEALASGFNITTERQQTATRQTLPNGRPFPGKAPARQQPPGPPPRNEVVIQFAPGSSQQDRNQYIRSIGGRSRRQIDALNTYAVTLAPNASADSLPASPIVMRAEPDYIASALQVNDPRFAEQWGLPVMGVPQTWQTLPEDLRTVTVAVIDSGICSAHPDLAGRITGGYDFVEGDTTPQDTFGHGCGVAGVVAANPDNGQGVAGVAPNAQVMPLRVLDETGNGNYSAISEAIVYAADNGAEIINLSLAGSFYSEIMAEAVAYAQGRGVQVIAASGNAGSNSPFYPAAFPGVVAVGSVDPDLTRSSFSNYGDHVRTLAPGRDILTTTRDGGYGFESGTSFAAPAVAGLAAIQVALGQPLAQTPDNIVYVSPGAACP